MADVNERANDNKKDRLATKLQQSDMQERDVADVADARSSAMESLNAELKKHTVSIEKQTEDVSKQNDILKDQVKGLDSSKNIFSNVFETFNPRMAWKYMKLKNALLDKMTVAVENVEIGDLENDIKITDILGDSPKQAILFSFQYAKIRYELLKKIESAVNVLEIKKLSTGNILSKVLDTPKDNKFFNLQYFLFRRSLLSKITKALPKKFNEVSPDLIQEKILESFQLPSFEMPLPEYSEKDSPMATPMAKVIGPENTIFQSETGQNDEPILSLLREINENVFLIKESISDALLKPSDDKKTILEEKSRLREEQKHEDLISTLKGISVDDSGAAAEDKGGGFIRSLLEKAFGIKVAAGAAALGGGILVKIAAVGKAISATVIGLFATISKSLLLLGGAITKTVLLISKGVSGALLILGKGVGLAIATVLGGLAKGLLLLSNPKLLLGVAVLAGLGGAIFIAGKAFQQFSEINWKSVGIGMATLAGIGVVAAALSLAAPVFLIGAGVIAALGLAMIPFAAAALLFSKAAGPLAAAIDTIIGSMGDFIVKIGDTISKIFDSITNSIQGLADVKGSELTDTANGLIALSGALVAYATGGTLAGVADGIRRLFGVDMVAQLVRLGETGPTLELAAHSLDRIGIAFKRIRLHSGKDTIQSIEAMTKALISNQNALSKSDGQGEFFKFALAFKGIADNSDKLISVFESGYKFLLEANKFKSFAINNLELTTPSELNAVNVGSQIYDEKERQPSQAEQIGRAVSESTNNIMTNLSETMTTVSAGGNVTSNYYQNTNIDYTQEKSVAGNMW
jgi:hypothetical protein